MKIEVRVCNQQALKNEVLNYLLIGYELISHTTAIKSEFDGGEVFHTLIFRLND